MLTASGLTKSYGERVLFDGVSLTLQAGERIGIVGPNGAGKSTLLRLILGLDSADAGQIDFVRGTRKGYLPQETEPAGAETVLDIALPHDLEADGKLVADAKRILVSLGFQQTDFSRPARELSGGWVMRAHLARLLVTEPDLLMLDEPTNHLDLETVLWLQDHLRQYRGGMLLISHDREFLNQLCTHVVEIRQGHVLRYTGNYDSYLRQREAAEQTLVATHKAQVREIERLQRFVDRFRAKNTKATQAQSKLRQIDRLRADMVAAPAGPEATVGFRFPQPERSGQRVVILKEVKFGYAAVPDSRPGSGRRQEVPSAASRKAPSLLAPAATAPGFNAPDSPARSSAELASPLLHERETEGGRKARKGETSVQGTCAQSDLETRLPAQKLIYENLSFVAERGQRIVLVGPNGAGKSTLLKLLAAVLEPQAGERRLGHNTRCGYYAQHRLAMLDASRTVLEEALDTPRRLGEQFVRTVLGSFLFRGDDVFKPVGVLSGGEKSRLALVKLLLDPPNLLLMDEPTTHLDLASVEALIEALEPYAGTLVFISHDVHFIRAVANHVVRVESGRLQHFPGGYDYYLDKTAQSARAGLTAGAAAAAAEAEAEVKPRVPDRKEQRRREAERRQARSRRKREFEKRTDALEHEIAGLESRERELAAELQSPATYATPGRAVEINTELRRIHDRLPSALAEWETAARELADVENETQKFAAD